MNTLFARFPKWEPGVFISGLPKLLQLFPIPVTRLRQHPDEIFPWQVMGFQQVFERLRVVPQFGVYQAYEQMGVHAFPFREIHAEILDAPRRFYKRVSKWRCGN
jgi:hypothetical protein